MKKLLLIILLAFSSSMLANNQVNVSSVLQSVKVFLSGAEMVHTGKIKLQKGMNEIVIDNIADNFNPNSLQFTAKGDATIISVSFRKNFLKAQQKSPQIISLEDSLKDLNYKSALETNLKETLLGELELINSNKNIGGDSGYSITDLQKIAEYYRKRVLQIKNEILESDRKLDDLRKDIERIKKQINELSAGKNEITEVVATVSSDKNTELEFTVEYLTYQAGWSPIYDLRAADINSPVKLDYKANVWQRSGIDWNDVKILLSTGNPSLGGSKPNLYPWYIDFIQYLNGAGRYEASDMVRSKSAELAKPSVMQGVVAEAETMADYVTVNQTQLTVEFEPEIKYSISSDGKPQIVALQNYQLPARYEYYAAPKLDRDAFLVAFVSDWSDYNLLQGKANIYFANSYVGETYINPNTSDDTLQVSLGRDKGIVIERKAIKDFTEDKFLSSDIERYFAFEITVRNNKNSKVNLILEDQIPISQNEDIEVNLQERDGAEYNKSNGFLKWKIDLTPDQTVKKKLVYSVRYPKDKPVSGLY